MGEEITCCFTGHRPHRLPWHEDELDPRCQRFRAELDRQVAMAYDRGYRHFISGMALGVDMYAAEIVLELKKTYPGITLESAIPCETQAAKWNATMRERYYGIAAQCDKEPLLQTHYTPDCMDKRNRYMVDHADYIIAVWDGKPSGTGKTVMYAQSKEKVIIKVNPATLTVERL